MAENVTQTAQTVIPQMSGTLQLAIFAIGSFVFALLITGAWVIQSRFMRCKLSKWIDYAHQKHLTIALMFKSNHVVKVTPCKVHANGYLETLSGNKSDPKHYIPILRTTFTRPVTEKPTDEEGNQQVKEASEIATIEQSILKPSGLEGSNCQTYLVYDGVACALTSEALVSMGFNSPKVQYKLPNELAIDKQGSLIPKKASQKISFFLDIMLPVNPQLVKKYLTKLYDQSTVDGYGQDKWTEGYQTAKKGTELLNKMVLIGGIAFGILGLVGGLVLKMIG